MLKDKINKLINEIDHEELEQYFNNAAPLDGLIQAKKMLEKIIDQRSIGISGKEKIENLAKEVKLTDVIEYVDSLSKPQLIIYKELIDRFLQEKE